MNVYVFFFQKANKNIKEKKYVTQGDRKICDLLPLPHPSPLPL
jgi:hypothetical protein